MLFDGGGNKWRYYAAVWPFVTRFFARRRPNHYRVGYVCGGNDDRGTWYDSIERLVFPFAGRTQHGGTLTEECPAPLACRADAYGHGYVFGGEGGKDLTLVDRLSLAGGDARWCGVIGVRHWDGYAFSSSTAGYVGAGRASLVGDLSTVHRGNFPFGGWMVECGSTEELSKTTAEANEEAGFIFGGQLPYQFSGAVYYYEFPVGHAFVVAGLLQQKRLEHGSCASTTAAYVVGGRRVDTVERYTFADHAARVVGLTLAGDHCAHHLCGCASREQGYLCGGWLGRYCTQPSRLVQALTFPFDDGRTVSVGELAQPRVHAAAL